MSGDKVEIRLKGQVCSGEATTVDGELVILPDANCKRILENQD